MSLPKMFTPLRLDRDLVSDRRRKAQSDPLKINIPDDIRMSTKVVFEILGHEPDNTYKIQFDRGQWTYANGIIEYQAPAEPGPVKLTITHANGVLFGFVIYRNGTVYDEKGNISQKDIKDGKLDYNGVEVDYDAVASQPIELPAIEPPVATNHDGGVNSGASDLLTFNVADMFGDLDGKKYRVELESRKNGNFIDYELPSESSKQPDAIAGVYSLNDDGGIAGVPRNSNVVGSGGNIFDGYREEGAVGGSLKVIKGDEIEERTDVWIFEVTNNALEAIMPDNLVALCLTNITVNPKLVGNPEGHTFLWEQIKGDDTSVTWLTPKNQPNISIEIGAIKTDRTFRFWISKGTKYERYYDYHLYGTPFENIPMFSTTPPPHGFGNFLNIMDKNTTPILLWHQNIWNKQLRLRIKRKY